MMLGLRVAVSRNRPRRVCRRRSDTDCMLRMHARRPSVPRSVGLAPGALRGARGGLRTLQRGV